MIGSNSDIGCRSLFGDEEAGTALHKTLLPLHSQPSGDAICNAQTKKKMIQNIDSQAISLIMWRYRN